MGCTDSKSIKEKEKRSELNKDISMKIWIQVLRACRDGNLKELKRLESEGIINQKIIIELRCWPLFLACKNNHLEVVKWIIIHYEITTEEIRSKYKRRSSAYVVSYDNSKIFEWIIGRYGIFPDSLLITKWIKEQTNLNPTVDARPISGSTLTTKDLEPDVAPSIDLVIYV